MARALQPMGMDAIDFPAKDGHAFHPAWNASSRHATMHGHPATRLRGFIRAAAFPCVGARASVASKALQVLALGDLRDPAGDAQLLDALQDFASVVDGERGSAVHSLVAVYRAPCTLDAAAFEALLWQRLQQLHERDVADGHRWAPGVSSDPDDPRFSLSLRGHAFFVVALHPASPRRARRFEAPALVFNSHQQFERLRADGRFAKMQAATRQRDTALQGSINPTLADFGTRSEARQYSGNPAGPGWRCPLRIRGRGGQ